LVTEAVEAVAEEESSKEKEENAVG